MWYRKIVLGMILLIAGDCGPRPEDDAMSAPPPPPAAVIAPVRESMLLEEKLERLEVELLAVLRLLRAEDAELGDAMLRLYRAESITDGLLEAQRPFEWLGVNYSLEARLRQLQAQADRMVAEQRRGASAGRLLVGARALRNEVVWLRRALAQGGGGDAPPPLDTLLAGSPDTVLAQPTDTAATQQ